MILSLCADPGMATRSTSAVYCCILFCLALVCVKGAVINIPDSNGRSLDHYLCNTTISLSNTVYILQSTVTHTLNSTDGSPLCVVRDATNITIRSSHPLQYAVIDCVSNDIGAAFINISYIYIESITFTNCGGNLSDTEALSLLNQRPWVEPPVQTPYPNFNESSTTLLFITCSMLYLQNIELDNYRGFGIIIKDVPDDTILDTITITNALNGSSPEYNGSGLLILHLVTNMFDTNSIPHSITLNKLTITDGWTDNFNDGLVRSIDIKDAYPIIRVPAGLTIIVVEPLEPMNPINVSITNMVVYNNTGGGVLLVLTTIKYSIVSIDNSIISSCLEAKGRDPQNRIGEALTVYYPVTHSRPDMPYSSQFTFVVRNVTFKASLTDSCRCGFSPQEIPKAFNLTTVMIRVIGDFVGQRVRRNHMQHILFDNVTFAKDFDGVTKADFGIGLYIYSFYSIVMVLRDTMVSNFSCLNELDDYDDNNPYFSCVLVGSLAFKRLRWLRIVNGVFTHHKECSVFYVQETRVEISGNVTIADNEGTIYGALQLTLSSKLYLQEPLALTMERNRALQGGALYVYEELSTACAIQVLPQYNYSPQNYTSMDIKFAFKSNTALLSGSTIYANLLHHCDNELFYHLPSSERPSLYNVLLSLMNISYDAPTTQVSSPASLVCLCNESRQLPELPCERRVQSRHLSAYPGEKIVLYIAAVDGTASVYGVVTASVRQLPPNVMVYIKQQDISSSVAAGICSQVEYDIFHNANQTTNVILELAPALRLTHTYINLTLLGCPPGLWIQDEQCMCLGIYSHFECTVNGTITRPQHYWVGYTAEPREQFAYSQSCLPGFCNDSLTSVTINTNLGEGSPMCNGGRTGTLCALCPDGRSVVFGSVECLVCSNWYIFTILLFCLCGILLVTLLFVLQLTVKVGTINGVIFYGNLLSTGFIAGYQVENNLYLLSIFISFLNLNLGFPLCFYDGMNEEVYRLLQFVFPVYVWIIIGIIIYASRHSIKLSTSTGKHSVAVLATLIQLSYSKIMTNIAESFPFVEIQTEKDGGFVVWFIAGVSYSSPLHIIHMLISLVFLILFIIPYTLIITLGPYLAKYRVISKFMPYFDAVYAPYKDKFRYWFGARLCLVLILQIFRVCLSGYSYKITLGTQLLFVFVFMLLQIHYKPFKSRLVHHLDVFYMVNFFLLGCLAITLPSVTYLLVSVIVFIGTALIVFIGIVCYHIYFVYIQERMPTLPVPSLPSSRKTSKVQEEIYEMEPREERRVSNDYLSNASSPPVTSVSVELREPVLDFID